MRKGISDRIKGLEDVLEPMDDAEKLLMETADSIASRGIPSIAAALRLLDPETPLTNDGWPSPWHERRIKKLRSRERTPEEEEELQEYLKKRRDQNAQIRALGDSVNSPEKFL